MCELYRGVEQLYSSGLYSCITELYPVLASTQGFSPLELANWNLFQAASLQHQREYKRAELMYKDALQAKKCLVRSKPRLEPDHMDGLIFNEIEIKFRLNECYIGMGESNQAVNILQSIPVKQRTPKINLALGKLYHQNGMERPAIACYREVLKECPLAIEATKYLLQLGVKPKEIQELSVETQALSQELSWWTNYLLIQSSLHSRDYKGCIRECKKLEMRPEMRGCVNILVTQGLAHHWAGEEEQARMVLMRAASLDRMLLSGMDSLASILASLGKHEDLEGLANHIMTISEERPEPWIAMGHYCHLIKKSQRAVFFAHKACLIDTRNVEALLLKGNVLLDLKKLPDAMNHFREALQLAPHRYEAHKGMVDCYLGQGRQREAVTVATGACKQLGNSGRALTLYASVLVKEPLSVARAKSLLERPAASGHLPAVYLLVDLLDREGAVDKAVVLLRTTLQQHATSRVHKLLADLLAKQNQEEAAMEHYSRALNLDPKSEGAISGLHKMEAGTEEGGFSLESTYDMEMAEVGSSHGSGAGGHGSPQQHRHPDLEDSETEAVWSDGDLNIMGGGSG